jgi:zinc protease
MRIHSTPSWIRAIVLVVMLLAGGSITPYHALGQREAGAIPAATGLLRQHVPQVVLDSLPNGLRIMFTRVNELPLVEINVIVDAGIGLEQPDAHGAAYAVNHLLMAGNEDRTGEMISNYVAELGSVIIPYVHYDYAQLYAKTLAKNFSATLGLLAGGVTTPLFPRQALQRLQQDASVRLLRNVSGGERATLTAVRSLCGAATPLSRSLLPTAEEVQALSIEGIRKYHASWYHPNRTTVIITGNLDYAFAKTAVLEAFGKWRNGEEGTAPAAVETAPVKTASVKSLTFIADSATPRGLAYFRIGGRGVLRGDGDFAALMLLNSIFSDGPESILRRALWSGHMISPNFTSAIAFSRECSYFIVSGSASPMLSDSVLTYIQEAVDRLVCDGVSDGQLAEARRSLLAGEPLTFATNRNLQGILKEAAVYGIPVDTALRFAESVRAVDKDDIQRVAKKVLGPEHRQTVVLGAAEKIVPILRGMGTEVRIVE